MDNNTFPDEYDKRAYVKWHENEFPEDAPLIEKIEQLIGELKVASEEHLPVLGQLLSQIAAHTEPECRIQSGNLMTGKFELPLADLGSPSRLDTGSELFKSVDSILDKLWRRNQRLRDESRTQLSNIRKVFGDLVRTSVVAPTFFHAQTFAERLRHWHEIVGAQNVDKHFKSIVTVTVDEEAKAASGYFAYHASIEFNGLVVEVQIFSLLSKAWRNVSHKVYERMRLGEDLMKSGDAPASRLVSLGHLLFLAEHELARIVTELRGRYL